MNEKKDEFPIVCVFLCCEKSIFDDNNDTFFQLHSFGADVAFGFVGCEAGIKFETPFVHYDKLKFIGIQIKVYCKS